MIIRAVRLLRIFRVLKIGRYVHESQTLMVALRASQTKIVIFLFAVVNMVLILGTLMYVVEGPEKGFTDIPTSVYWAIVTLTTVGYGDLSPQTGIGRFISCIAMIMGYGIIAVPTGIVSVELNRASLKTSDDDACPSCQEIISKGANFCSNCGVNITTAKI